MENNFVTIFQYHAFCDKYPMEKIVATSQFVCLFFLFCDKYKMEDNFVTMSQFSYDKYQVEKIVAISQYHSLLQMSSVNSDQISNMKNIVTISLFL